jgi:hypothetical protein
VVEGEVAGVEEGAPDRDRLAHAAVAAVTDDGWPTAARWTRIWWVLPVSSVQASRSTAAGSA